MAPLSSLERRALRARAHHLHPVVAVGLHGLTPAVLHEIDVALTAHELIKVRVFSDARADRESLLTAICLSLDCAPIQHLGKVLVVWRPNPDRPAPRKRKTAAKPSPAAPAATRRGKSPRTRAAPPKGMPRAPTRRTRGIDASSSAVVVRGGNSRRRRSAVKD
jgi:putative YhbY family RNA-binding protein